MSSLGALFVTYLSMVGCWRQPKLAHANETRQNNTPMKCVLSLVQRPANEWPSRVENFNYVYLTSWKHHKKACDPPTPRQLLWLWRLWENAVHSLCSAMTWQTMDPEISEVKCEKTTSINTDVIKTLELSVKDFKAVSKNTLTSNKTPGNNGKKIQISAEK